MKNRCDSCCKSDVCAKREQLENYIHEVEKINKPHGITVSYICENQLENWRAKGRVDRRNTAGQTDNREGEER